MFKKEVRIIAWDDCAFGFNQKEVRLVGVVFRGAEFIDGLLSIEITKDGMDATEKIIASMKNSRHFDQLSVIMLDGITFAGFNMVDIAKLNKETGLPVMAVQRKMPDMDKFTAALKRTEGYGNKMLMVKNAGKIYTWNTTLFRNHNNKQCSSIKESTSNISVCQKHPRKMMNSFYNYRKTYFQKAGISEEECIELLKLTCKRSNIPEPIRVAHIIASGLSRAVKSGYESRGRA